MKRTILILGLLLVVIACTQTPVACRTMSGKERVACTIDEAVRTNDASFCDSLKETSHKDWCFTDVAAATDDSAACDRVSTEAGAAFCRTELFLARGNVAECDSLLHLPAKDTCYDDFARERQEWSICTKMSRGNYRETCIEDVARQTEDPYGCLLLEKSNPNREGCLFALSIEAANPETCRELSDENYRAFCLLNIAVNSQDETLCDGLSIENTCRNLVKDAKAGTTAAEPILPAS